MARNKEEKDFEMGNRLALILKAKLWNQADLARKTGNAESSISSYINGTKPGTDFLRNLKKAIPELNLYYYLSNSGSMFEVEQITESANQPSQTENAELEKLRAELKQMTDERNECYKDKKALRTIVELLESRDKKSGDK